MGTDANAPAEWDRIWSDEGADTWRRYPELYDRIVELVPDGSEVLDVGGGVGVLADRLRAERNCPVTVLDHSQEALKVAAQSGHRVWRADLESDLELQGLGNVASESTGCTVATEVLEHLTEHAMRRVLAHAREFPDALFSVPNDCMGPDVESQHHRQFTALEFLTLLREYWPGACRVECIGRYLLGICGAHKGTTLSVAFPVKNEAADLEATLRSYRGVADEIVIGIDSASTDESEEIAKRYAEKVFTFTWENSFAKARNACIDESSGDWILTAEGHMPLKAGRDYLLRLDGIPSGITVLEPTIETRASMWRLPYIFRNNGKHRFYRNVHNALDYDEGCSLTAPEVVLWHERHIDNAKERVLQRRYMNRKRLMEDLRENPKDSRSLFYLASEWSANRDVPRAIDCYERFLAMHPRGNAFTYQARLALSRLYVRQKRPQAAYDCLTVATRDDWSRTEHWMLLGDLCMDLGQVERAMRFYQCAAQGIHQQPVSFLWVEKATYSYLPAQRLVTVYSALGFKTDALAWAERVPELLPDWASDEAREEAQQTITKIKEWIHGNGRQGGDARPDQRPAQQSAA